MLDSLDAEMIYGAIQEQTKLLGIQNTLLTNILTTMQQQSKLLQDLNNAAINQSKLLVSIKSNKPVYHYKEP